MSKYRPFDFVKIKTDETNTVWEIAMPIAIVTFDVKLETRKEKKGYILNRSNPDGTMQTKIMSEDNLERIEE